MEKQKITIEEEVYSYTRVPNVLAKNESTSWEARGLYLYLIGLPPNWVIYKSDLEKRASNSYYSTMKAWKELEKLGYIETKTVREKGLFKGYEYFVRRQPICEIEKPVDEPICDTPISIIPISMSRQLINKEIDSSIHNTINKEKNTESLKKDSVSNNESIKPLNAYKQIIDFWLKDFHKDFSFTAVHGQKVKSIITKIKNLLKHHDQDTGVERIVDFFKLTCNNLPEYYKNKDLSVIDSKFNEIISEIKQIKNGKNPINTKPVSRFRTA